MKAKARVRLFFAPCIASCISPYQCVVAATYSLLKRFTTLRVFVPAVLFFASCFYFPAAPVRGDEISDWAAFNTLSAKVEPLKKTNPQAALQSWEAFLQEHPDLIPTLVAYAHHHIAELLGDALDSPDKALQTLDLALQKLQDDPAAVIVLEGKARVAVAGKARRRCRIAAAR